MKVLFSFAHPDDESFSCGGTIAALTKQGTMVQLITATRGEAGQCGEPPITTKAQLHQVREQELRDAAKVLGIEKIYFLDFIDGMLYKVKQSVLQQKVAVIMYQEKPDIVITFDRTGISNHKDHKRMSQITTAAFKEYAKGIDKHVRLYHTATPKSYVNAFINAGLMSKAFGIPQGTKDEDITTIVDIKDTYALKQQAMRCHKTQHKDWERFFARELHVDLTKEYFSLMWENRLL